MGQAITVVASGGLAITEVASGFGLPVEVVTSGGIAATIVASGGLPVVGAGLQALNGSISRLKFSTSQYQGGTLATLLTTTRALPALTYARNVAGTLTGFAANTPRITDKGLLTEATATNIGLQSQTFDNVGVWTPTNAPVTANAFVAPDGTTTMDKIVPNASVTSHLIAQTGIIVTAASWAISCYVDSTDYPYFGIRESALTGAYATFFCSGNGQVAALGAPATKGFVERMFGNIYRCTMIYTGTAASHSFQLFAMDINYASGSPLAYNYAGDTVKGMGLWGFQAEAGAKASSYIPTTTVSVARSADVNKLAGAALTALTGSDATVMVITSALGFVPAGGARLIGSNSPVPLNCGSDVIAQDFNGAGSANANLPFSAKFSTDDIWAISSWTTGLTTTVANGGTPGTDAHSQAAITDIYIGTTNGGNALGGYIKEVDVWNTALSSAVMQTLSAPGATFNAAAVEAWGDSLTSGNQDSTGTTYPNVLAGLLGIPVYNDGVGGEDSTKILARFVAFPAGWGSPQIFQWGRNDFATPTIVKANIATGVADLSTTHYLIGSVLPSANDTAPNLATIVTLNGDLATLYTTRFVDLLAALQAAGNGGANDNADIAAGIIPRSLRVGGGTDPLHLNAAGYTVIANAYYAKKSLLGL